MTSYREAALREQPPGYLAKLARHLLAQPPGYPAKLTRCERMQRARRVRMYLKAAR